VLGGFVEVQHCVKEDDADGQQIFSVTGKSQFSGKHYLHTLWKTLVADSAMDIPAGKGVNGMAIGAIPVHAKVSRTWHQALACFVARRYLWTALRNLHSGYCAVVQQWQLGSNVLQPLRHVSMQSWTSKNV
jgi:hypothetical protein